MKMVKGDAQIKVDETIPAGLMGLAGAIIGGACSYFGGIKGAKRNIELIEQFEKKQAKIRLLKQLEFTFGMVKNHKDRGLRSNEQFVYDYKWMEYITTIDLDKKSIETVILWFYRFDTLKLKQKEGQSITVDDFNKTFDANIMERVDKAIQNIKTV